MKPPLIEQNFKTVEELLNDPARWCKGTLFRDELNNATKEETATKCCLLGATKIVYGSYEAYYTATRKLLDITGYTFPLAHVNDKSTHEQVLALVRKAQV